MDISKADESVDKLVALREDEKADQWEYVMVFSKVDNLAYNLVA